MVIIKALLFTLLLSTLAMAEFYQDIGTGYYQYASPDVSDNTTEYKRPLVPSDEELAKMPTKQFAALVTETLEYALTVRNIDTYGDYARMQIVAGKRASEFASLQMLYAQLNPPENENQYARDLNADEIRGAINKRLNESKSEYGLLYFYSPTCSYCAKTEPLLQAFIDRHGWEIEAINIAAKPALAEAFEVTTTPALKLVDRNKKVLPISNGFISLPEIEERAYRHIRYLRGETTEQTFGESLGTYGAIK